MTLLEVLVAVSLTLSVALTAYTALAIREQDRRIRLLQQMCESRYNQLMTRMDRREAAGKTSDRPVRPTRREAATGPTRREPRRGD